MDADVKAFCDRQIAFVAAEQTAEAQQNAVLVSSAPPPALAAAGLALLNLVLANQRTGLGGKTVLELERDSAISGKDAAPLEHGLRAGDIVCINQQPKGAERKAEKANLTKEGADGVVVRVRNQGLDIALDDGREEQSERFDNRRLWVYVPIDEAADSVSNWPTM